MANQKISQLPSGTNAQAGDLFVIARGGANLALTTAQLFNAPSAAATFASLAVSGNLAVDTNTLFVDAANNRVGVGTASPAFDMDIRSASSPTLQIRNTANGIGNFAQIRLDIANSFSAGGTAYLRAISRNAGNSQTDLAFGVNAGGGGAPFEAMLLDNSGNLGIGVTPSAWSASFRALQVSGLGALWGSSTGFFVSNNTYNDGSNKYIGNGFATRYYQSTGEHVWENATSNTSGAGAACALVQAMTLNASGNLGVGTASPNDKLELAGALRIQGSNSGITVPALGTNAGRLKFLNGGSYGLLGDVLTNGDTYLQSGRIDGSSSAYNLLLNPLGGSIGIGTSSPAHRLQVNEVSGADRDVFAAQVAGASNGFQIKWKHSTTKTHVIITDIPTSSAGLPAGTLYSDGGTIKIA